MKTKPIKVENFLALFPWSEVLRLSMKNVKTAVAESDISIEAFTPQDVKSIIDYHEGGNDLEDWIMVGTTKDNRYFYLKSGCGYDGFDKYSWGEAKIAHSLTTLYKEAIMEDEKMRFNPEKIYSIIDTEKNNLSLNDTQSNVLNFSKKVA